MTADQHFQTCAHEMGLDFNGEIKIGGNYSPVVRDVKQLWVSGQIPRVGDEVLFVGVVGETLDVAQGKQAAAIGAMRALALLQRTLGSLESIADDRHVVVANIASPVTVRNIAQQPQVCLSFVDVLVQKGFKLTGTARELLPSDADYAGWAASLLAMTGDRIPLRSVLLITVQGVQPIVAPSYWLFPQTTTEAAQIEAARRTYGLGD